MKCLKCGTDNNNGLSFCKECGEELSPTEKKKTAAADITEDKEPDDEIIEEKTISNQEKKFKISNSKNPMFVAFIIAFLISVIFVSIAAISFTISSAFDGGSGIGFGIACSVIALFGFFIAFYFYFTPALNLRSMQKGNAVASWQLSDDDINEHAKELQKGSFNKMFWALLLIGLFSLVLAILFLSFGGDKGIYMAIPMFLVIIVCAAIAILMPKTAEKRIKKLGRDVIIGRRGVYANGMFYHWHGLVPELTTAVFNGAKRQLTISFTTMKNEVEEIKRVIVKVPAEKIGEVQSLIGRYDELCRLYREKQQRKEEKNAQRAVEREEKEARKASEKDDDAE